MSKLRQLLRLYSQGESKLNISKLTGLSRNTVKKYIKIFIEKELTIEDISALSDEQLDKLFDLDYVLYESDRYKQLMELLPEYEKRLKKRNVSRESLWKEYILKYPEGYMIAQFKRYIRKWIRHNNPVMHIEHKVGDKMYIDFTGEKLSIINKTTGEIKTVEVFVSILGSSQYTYVEAVESQSKENFIRACENALYYYGGVPKAIVPDNLKSAVTKSDKYEPTLNEAFEDFASHYNTAILPARVYKPKDKALVEGAVKIVYRRIFDEIKENEHYTIEELNNAILDKLEGYNDILLTGRPYSRKQLFDELEKKELHPLSNYRYELKRKQTGTVHIDGHVCLRENKNYYSVPYKFIGSIVRLIYSNRQVDIYHRNILISSHPISYKMFYYSTDNEHLASTHKFVNEWNPERYINWATSIDQNVSIYIKQVLQSKPHPEQAYKTCHGILMFERKYSRERLINACKRAIEYNIYNYGTIKNILENGYDKIEEPSLFGFIPDHPNIRGEEYYQ